MHIQVAVLCAWPTGLTFARQTNACPILHAGRDRHLDAALPLHRAGAMAHPAGIADDPSLAAAGRAGSFDQEEPLLGTNLSAP